MKTSKNWGPCSCDCGKNMEAGQEIVIFDGSLYLAGHENRRKTTQISVVKKEENKPKAGKKIKKKNPEVLELFEDD
ncbi:MAG: hypothetical protein PHC61_14070 [Chitinivibrionales bacterium]|nr:hypothetical protein [Chitinivibrionales bacterium]